MICSLKHSALSPTTINGSDPVVRRNTQLAAGKAFFLSPIGAPKGLKGSLLVSKPLHLTSIEAFSPKERNAPPRSIVCKAYEAEPVDAGEAKPEAARKAKIGVYFATWWALNVVFNIYNKKVLNAFPYPWLTSTLSLACGSLMMLISWVAVAHTIGHVAATVSMSKVAVSFTHIIKSESFPAGVYLSLLPIIGGCALAAVTELNFNMIGFMGAMISNLAFVFRNIFSKKGMKGKSVSGMNYYACLSMLSLLILTPFAIAVEGPQMWAAGWQNALSQIGPNFVCRWVAAQSVFYHLYNQVSYMSRFLDHHLPHTCPARQCFGSCHRRPWNLLVFPGSPPSPLFSNSSYLFLVVPIEINILNLYD
ncbi:unnamed protein product [Linum tenue]|uniref:Sugar phosphate transporter domain-containing protein n=1 Tax=Linum tenue TaxID=586396 RepID=A0AAV0LSI5_9ROSI|nr:unnamed protein product [Linum tenue]